MDHQLEHTETISFEAKSIPILPHPKVLNLLLTVIYAEIARSGKHDLPGCYKAEEVLELLDQLPAFKSYEQVEKALSLPQTMAQTLLSRICVAHGNNFGLATKGQHIPGFEDDVFQMVVSKPLNVTRYYNFLAELEREKSESILLFHGSALHNLLPILSDGFRPSSDKTYGEGIFMAENPMISFRCAHFQAWFRSLSEAESQCRALIDWKGGNNLGVGPSSLAFKKGDIVTAMNESLDGQQFYIHTNTSEGNARGWAPSGSLEKVASLVQKPIAWSNSPFLDRAMVLGCHIAGKGRLVDDISEPSGSVHVITNPDSIVVRYVFVLPEIECYLPKRTFGAPERSVIEKPMLDAFDRLIIEDKARKLDDDNHIKKGYSTNNTPDKAIAISIPKEKHGSQNSTEHGSSITKKSSSLSNFDPNLVQEEESKVFLQIQGLEEKHKPMWRRFLELAFF